MKHVSFARLLKIVNSQRKVRLEVRIRGIRGRTFDQIIHILDRHAKHLCERKYSKASHSLFDMLLDDLSYTLLLGRI